MTGDTHGRGSDEQHAGRAEEVSWRRLWHIEEVRFATAAGVFLLAGYATGWADGPVAAQLTLKALALALGVWTFVPSVRRRMAKRRPQDGRQVY